MKNKILWIIAAAVCMMLAGCGGDSGGGGAPPPLIVPEEDTCAELDAIVIADLMYYFYQEIALPIDSGGLEVTWMSDSPHYPVKDYPADAINQNLKRVMVRDNVEGEFHFNLTALAVKNGVTYRRTFPVTAREKNYYGYLLAYFNGDTPAGEQVRYALSENGFDFTAINNNQPVISSPAIARTNSARDPFVTRGHDGIFRMVLTDMRSTLGWDSNRGIILLKSNDLINWTSNQIHFPDRFGGDFAQDSIRLVWAPETIYDRASGKYLVHFAIAGPGADPQKIYYSWANDDFTDLTATPEILYAAPNNSARIDMSVVYFNGIFHAVVKNEDNDGDGAKHIQKLESAAIDRGYEPIAFSIDGESVRTEGCELYRLIGSDTWVHLYDAFNSNRYGFKTSANMRDWTVANGSTKLANGGNFVPRHGSVIPVTEEEYTRLQNNQEWM